MERVVNFLENSMISSCYPPMQKFTLLSPTPNDNKISNLFHTYTMKKSAKIFYYFFKTFQFSFFGLLYILVMPLYLLFSVLNKTFNRDLFLNKKSLIDEEKSPLPQMIGFADSFFQTGGRGLNQSNWKDWLENLNENPETIDKYFVNFLEHPETLVAILKKCNMTSYRFSVERSEIETSPSYFDMNKLELYRNFCKHLRENGITPWVTLHHFVDPAWFQKKGRFLHEENILGFVHYAERVIDCLKDEVTYFMTFNEPAIYIFQSHVRKAYPHSQEETLCTAGIALKNILSAHVLIYQSIKQKYPHLMIGITHQWLKFDPFNPLHPFERIVARTLTKITHYAIYNFFKTGIFEYQFPFLCNVRFETKEKKLTDFTGMQWYGRTELKMGFNDGKNMPGYGVKNILFKNLGMGLTFGATCKKGKMMQSFGPPLSLTKLREDLIEAFELPNLIAITEIGCDARLQPYSYSYFAKDNAMQKLFFIQLFRILSSLPKQHSIIALFIWTLLRGNLEWERKQEVLLGLIQIESKKAQEKTFTLTPAGEYVSEFLQKTFKS